MRIFKRLILLFSLLLVIIPVLVLVLIVQSEPAIEADHRLSQEHVRRIKYVIRQADPRRLRIGSVRSLNIAGEDLNLVLNYGAAQVPDSAVEVELGAGHADVKAAIDLNNLAVSPLPGFLNLSFRVAAENNALRVRQLRIGNLMVPDAVSGLLQDLTHKTLLQREDYQAVISSVSAVSIAPQRLLVTYKWHQELKDQLRITGAGLLFTKEQQERLTYYYQHTQQLYASLGTDASLEKLLAPLFQTAYDRSNEDTAMEENRILLIAAGFFVAGVDVESLFQVSSGGEAQGESIIRRRFLDLTLAGRADLAKHYVMSAGISASAGTQIANAAGLFKELRDSQGGSGFSFADLAADRAGTRLAELAIAPESARKLQRLMSQATEEGAFMPDVTNLPEGIQEFEFTQQFENMDNEAYRIASSEIENRLEACPVFSQALL